MTSFTKQGLSEIEAVSDSALHLSHLLRRVLQDIDDHGQTGPSGPFSTYEIDRPTMDAMRWAQDQICSDAERLRAFTDEFAASHEVHQ
jgi:hypothetical protein